MFSSPRFPKHWGSPEHTRLAAGAGTVAPRPNSFDVHEGMSEGHFFLSYVSAQWVSAYCKCTHLTARCSAARNLGTVTVLVSLWAVTGADGTELGPGHGHGVWTQPEFVTGCEGPVTLPVTHGAPRSDLGVRGALPDRTGDGTDFAGLRAPSLRRVFQAVGTTESRGVPALSTAQGGQWSCMVPQMEEGSHVNLLRIMEEGVMSASQGP